MAEYFGKDVFKLGFGLMRLPKLEDGKSIDVEQTAKMVDLFMEAGGTYFDTAYVCDDGRSEEAAREALVKRHPRESFTLATKLHSGFFNSFEGRDEVFNEQLRKTGAGYFDYYLLHALQEGNYRKYDEYHIWDFVKEMKAKGLIRHFGFSFHDSPEMLDRLLTKHPEVDFVQLQINYADWENPGIASRANYEMARKHGKSITVMEPVKGGALADPIPEVKKILNEADPKASYASWAIRYAASLDGIITVLSGMSNIAQMEDNLSYMKEFQPLSDTEKAAIRRAQFALEKSDSIKCTGCHYCTGGCPMEIAIPEIFSACNEQLVSKDHEKGMQEYEKAAAKGGRASECVHCLQCEEVCPQKLPITSFLEKAAEMFE